MALAFVAAAVAIGHGVPGADAAGVAGGSGVSLRHVPFPEGPPARVTGGFGDDTCAACHFAWDDDPPPGRTAVAGFPSCFEAGASYDVEVIVEDPDMEVAGFQLAIRHAADGSQAGALEVPKTEAGRVAVVEGGGLLLAQHRLDGSTRVEDGAARWRIRWTAPVSSSPIVLNAAGLAGDGDRSQAGDRVYAVQLESSGESCPPDP